MRTAVERRQFCLGCGYPLADSPACRCPECGRLYDPASARTFGRRPWSRHFRNRLLRWSLVTVAVAVLATALCAGLALGADPVVMAWSASPYAALAMLCVLFRANRPVLWVPVVGTALLSALSLASLVDALFFTEHDDPFFLPGIGRALSVLVIPYFQWHGVGALALLALLAWVAGCLATHFGRRAVAPGGGA